jgi:GDSL-like Lipase/Acylhydrolase family
MRRKWRELGKKLLVLGASLAFSFLVLEIYVRATWQSQWHIPREAVRAPGIFSARMKPDVEVDIPLMDGGTFHVKTNARGFRGPLVSAMAGEPLKVLSLGDSYTFGWGLALEDHCMTRFMRGYRAAHPDRDVGHAYVACGSWDPKDYYLAYLTEASAAKPDLVVLGVFTGNDVMPADAPRFLDPAQALDVETIPDPPRPLFRSVEWLGVMLSSNLFAVQVGFRARRKASAFALFENDMAQQKKLWDTSFFYIEALDQAVRRDGGRLAVLLYPSLLQVNTRDQLERAGYDHGMPERVMGAFCAERGIAFIPILDALEAANQKRDLFYPKDRHLTARGNEVAAAVLAERLGPIVDRMWEAKTSEGPR